MHSGGGGWGRHMKTTYPNYDYTYRNFRLIGEKGRKQMLRWKKKWKKDAQLTYIQNGKSYCFLFLLHFPLSLKAAEVTKNQAWASKTQQNFVLQTSCLNNIREDHNASIKVSVKAGTLSAAVSNILFKQHQRECFKVSVNAKYVHYFPKALCSWSCTLYKYITIRQC